MAGFITVALFLARAGRLLVLLLTHIDACASSSVGTPFKWPQSKVFEVLHKTFRLSVTSLSLEIVAYRTYPSTK